MLNRAAYAPYVTSTIIATAWVCVRDRRVLVVRPHYTDAFYLPGTWVQFSHLEIEYYERFGNPGHARRAAEGREIWGRR